MENAVSISVSRGCDPFGQHQGFESSEDDIDLVLSVCSCFTNVFILTLFGNGWKNSRKILAINFGIKCAFLRL